MTAPIVSALSLLVPTIATPPIYRGRLTRILAKRHISERQIGAIPSRLLLRFQYKATIPVRWRGILREYANPRGIKIEQIPEPKSINVAAMANHLGCGSKIPVTKSRKHLPNARM